MLPLRRASLSQQGACLVFHDNTDPRMSNDKFYTSALCSDNIGFFGFYLWAKILI